MGRQLTFSEQVRWDGNAMTWDDWMFPAIIVNLPAIADPRYGKWLDDGAGSAGIWGWFFDVNEVAPLVSQQLPHRAAQLGAAMQPHVHFGWVTAPSVGDTVTWDVEYVLASRNAQFAATTSHLTGTYTATAADVVRRHATCDLSPTISVPANAISAIAHVTVKRAGTHAHEVFLGGFDIHFQSDSLGSDTAAVKAV